MRPLQMMIMLILLILAAPWVAAQEPPPPEAEALQVQCILGLHTVMAPLRKMARFLGCEQSWDFATDTVRLRGDDWDIEFAPEREQVVYTRRGPAAGDEPVVIRKDLPEAPRFSGGELHVPVPDLWRVPLQSPGGEVEPEAPTPVDHDPSGMEFAVGDQTIRVSLLSEAELELVRDVEGSVVRLETARGDIFLELFDDKTPITVGSFLDLVSRGFYDGLTFHRVIAGFMIQGGCPGGDGTGGPGFTIPDEADRDLEHLRGSLSMAKTPAPNTGGSQFFICHEPQPHLDGVHSVFGRCIAGMDVVDSVQQGDVIRRALILQRSDFAQEAVPVARAARTPRQD